jgi:putative hydrolase of the HAD superfamily
MYRIKKNVIFDFYGTLVDIHTDEEKMSLWENMKDYYRVYGADYTAIELKERYHQIVQAEEEALRKQGKAECVEIDLGRVFVRLLKADRHHETEMTIAGIHPADLKEEDVGRLMHSDWAYSTANLFRLLSREVFQPYDDTIPVLEKLKKEGHHLYLLSNAQALFTRCEVEMSGVRPYLDAVYLSSDHGMKKPDPRFMELLLEEQCLNRDECMMIGNDISSDMAIAHACHMDSLFLNTFGWDEKKIEQERKEAGIGKGASAMIEDGRLEHMLKGEVAYA